MLLNSNPVRKKLVQREIHTRQWIFKNRSQMFFKKKSIICFFHFIYLFIYFFLVLKCSILKQGVTKQ